MYDIYFLSSILSVACLIIVIAVSCYPRYIIEVSFVFHMVTLIYERFCTFIGVVGVHKSILSEIAEAVLLVDNRRSLSFRTSVHSSTHNMSEAPAENSPSPKCISEKCPTPPRSIPSPEATETGVSFLIELNHWHFMLRQYCRRAQKFKETRKRGVTGACYTDSQPCTFRHVHKADCLT